MAESNDQSQPKPYWGLTLLLPCEDPAACSAAPCLYRAALNKHIAHVCLSNSFSFLESRKGAETLQKGFVHRQGVSCPALKLPTGFSRKKPPSAQGLVPRAPKSLPIHSVVPSAGFLSLISVAEVKDALLLASGAFLKITGREWSRIT